MANKFILITNNLLNLNTYLMSYGEIAYKQVFFESFPCIERALYRVSHLMLTTMKNILSAPFYRYRHRFKEINCLNSIS